MSRPLLTALLLVAAVVSSAFVASEPAGATTADCLSSQGYFYDGHTNSHNDDSGNTFEGIYGDIDLGAGDLCPNDAARWTQWIMVSNNTNATLRAHAQVGYYEDTATACPYFVSEYQEHDGGSFVRTIDFSAGCRTGSGTYFKVDYNPNTTYENMWANGNLIDTAPFSIYTEWNATKNFLLEAASESNYIGTNIPGTPTNFKYYTNIILQRYDNSWTSQSQDLPPDWGMICDNMPLRYGQYTMDVSNHRFPTWTYNTSSSTQLIC